MNLFRKIANRIDNYRYINHVNQLLTLWVNLKWFPFKTAIKLPVYVYGSPRIAGSGKVILEAEPRKGMIAINFAAPWAPANMMVPAQFLNAGTVIFKGGAKICTGTKTAVHSGATLVWGDNAKLYNNSIIGCMNRIELGKNVLTAHWIQIFDTNYHYIMNTETGEIHNNRFTVKIGDGSWIANSVTICGDVTLPMGTIVSSNSLVNRTIKDQPPFSLIGGTPAKLLRTHMRRIYNEDTELKLTSFFAQNPGATYTYDSTADLETLNLL